MASNPWVQYGALGILAIVVCVIIPRFFNKVLKVVENNTEAFTEVKGSMDNLSGSIDRMNGNQLKLTETVQKTVHDQEQIGKLHCEALTKINKNISSMKREIKKCPKKMKSKKKKR